MFKFASLAFVTLAQAQTFTCIEGTDDATPFVLPKTVSTATCKFCTISAPTGSYDWGCNTDWEFPITVPTDQLTNGAVCLTGGAIVQNYASKDQVKMYKAGIQAEIDEQKAVGKEVTFDALWADMADDVYFYCTKANCNNIATVTDACKSIKTLAYDATKDTGFWKDSGAAALVFAASAITATLSLI